MNIDRTALSLAVICLLIVLFSAGGIVWGLLAGLGLSMDGILLILVCLMMGGIFSLLLLNIAKTQGWLPSRRRGSASPTEAAGSSGEGK